MTSPFIPPMGQGPRPIQQLLQVMQWGEQQKLAQQQADVQKQRSTADIVNTFMQIAPNQAPEDRVSLAQVMGRAAGVDPNMLLGAVAKRPQSAATTGDAAASLQFEGIQKPALERAGRAAQSVPDSVIQDATTNAMASAITGMGAGASRQSATLGNPSKISDKDLITGLTNQLGVTLTADQKKHYETQAEQLRQGWTKLADDKTAEAARIAIAQGQLMLEKQKMDLLKEGKVKEAMALPFGNPEESLKALSTLVTTATSGSMSKEAKAAMAPVLRAYQQQLSGFIRISNPALADEFDKAFSPENVLGLSPSPVKSMLGAHTKR